MRSLLIDPADRSTQKRIILCVLLAAILVAPAYSQMTASAPTSAPAFVSSISPASYYGYYSLAPAILAIVLAIATRQVVVAMSLGILLAAGMMSWMAGERNPLHFVTYAVDHYLIGRIAWIEPGKGLQLSKLKIIIYTLFIGAMIGVIEANGGTRAIVARLARRLRTRQGAQLGAVSAGLFLFIDDYASAMIVGPGLRPVFDRMRLSREKLAYLINTMAVTMASLFIGTWLAIQIGYLQGGFDQISGKVPAFLSGMTATHLFWACIPYRTYTLLAIVMAGWVALTGRDFGPMRGAEISASKQPPTIAQSPVTIATADDTSRWHLAFIPGLVLIAMTFALMITSGREIVLAQGGHLLWSSAASIADSLKQILGQTDADFALLHASLTAAVVAIILTVVTRALTLAKTMDAAVAGMSRMFAACIILVLAWGLSQASKDLQLGQVAEHYLQRWNDQGKLTYEWLPLCVFLTSCFIAFSIGTSWGTMALLLPPVISIAAGLLSDKSAAQALPIFYSCVGGVMAGAVFGNHCSPVSDTTIISAIFTECDIANHVRTQLPYGLTILTVSVASTTGLNYLLSHYAASFYQTYWTVYYGLLAGAIMLLLILLVAGRRTREPIIEIRREPSPPLA